MLPLPCGEGTVDGLGLDPLVVFGTWFAQA